jgi:hypothetical protein
VKVAGLKGTLLGGSVDAVDRFGPEISLLSESEFQDTPSLMPAHYWNVSVAVHLN